jgi:hypothetical protein
MKVPEAAVYKHNCPATRKHNVGRAWQGSIMQPKSKAKTMQHGANSQLRGRVRRPYSSHDAAALSC